MPELQRPGAVLNYEVWGDDAADGPSRPWITLINGHTRPLNDFRMMGRHLVERGLRVVALDNRGAGQTQLSAPFHFADFVADVVALWRELGVERSHVAGISMGGFISQEVALRHPEHVAQLVLISTAMNQGRIRQDDTPWTTDLAAVDAKLRPYFTADFARRNETLVKSMVKQIAKNVETGAFAAKSEQQKQAARGYDASARLATLKAPTLVVHGDQDAIIPVAAARELAERIPGARLEVLRDAGHLLLAERPKEVYALVGDWVLGVPG